MNLSKFCFYASLASVAASIATWVTVGDTDPAHAERFGIFIGLWAPTLMGMANHYKEQCMSGNLSEFIKVFAVVFGTASLILMVRSTFMSLTMTKPRKEEDPERQSDVADYDGMGDHSRFPSRN